MIRFLTLITCVFLVASTAFAQNKGGKFWRNIDVYFPEDITSTEVFNAPKPKTVADLESYQGKPLPAVVLLHGCGGINTHIKKWGLTIAKAGYLVLIPNAKLIEGYPKYGCSAGNFPPRDMQKKLYKMRRKQIGTIVRRIKEIDAVQNSRVFIMGHSEGASTLVQIKAKFFKGAVVSGLKCSERDIIIDSNVPVLFLNFQSDPWFPNQKTHGSCDGKIAGMVEGSEMLLPGHSHNTGEVEAARKRVIEFFDTH
jgi:dienelactone hydrolase